MKKLHVYYLVMSVLLSVFIFACSVSTTPLIKDFTVYRMGIDSESPGFLKAGETVKVYAQANYNKNVRYEWEVNGAGIPEEGERFSWTVPIEPGEYIFSVKAYHPDSDSSADKSITVCVYDDKAYPLTSNYKMTLKETVTSGGKSVPQTTAETIQEIISDGNKSLVKISNDMGERIYYFEGEKAYSCIDGKKEDISGTIANPSDKTMDAISSEMNGVFSSLDRMVEFYGNYVEEDGIAFFSAEQDNIMVRLGFDLEYKILSVIETYDYEIESRNKMSMEFQIVDGFLFPLRQTSRSEIVIANELVQCNYVTEYEDVSVNSVEDKDFEGDLLW